MTPTQEIALRPGVLAACVMRDGAIEFAGDQDLQPVCERAMLIVAMSRSGRGRVTLGERGLGQRTISVCTAPGAWAAVVCVTGHDVHRWAAYLLRKLTD